MSVLSALAERIPERIQHTRVISVGHMTHDRYDQEWITGGSAFFGAKVASGLGAQSSLFTAVGEDFTLDEQLRGIEAHILRTGETTIFSNLYPKDHPRIQLVEAQASTLRPDDFPLHWLGDPHKQLYPHKHQDQSSSIDLLFLAPVIGEVDPTDHWVRFVNANYSSLSLQGFMKKRAPKESVENQRVHSLLQTHMSHQMTPRGEVVTPRLDPLPPSLFEGVDALFLSDEDLELFGTDETLAQLREHVTLIFVTLGEHGCHIYEDGEAHPQHIGVYATDVTDPTGAGDTFAMSASLALNIGLSPAQAALFGSAAASVVIEGRGSSTLSRISEVYERYDQLRSSLKK